MGHHDEALPLHRRALAVSEETMGKTHRDTLTSVGKLGSLLKTMGHHEEELALNRRVGMLLWRPTGQDDEASLRFFSPTSHVRELNLTAHDAALASDGPLWLMIYFAPWCHQCLANKAYFTLAARQLQKLLGDERVRVGALFE